MTTLPCRPPRFLSPDPISETVATLLGRLLDDEARAFQLPVELQASQLEFMINWDHKRHYDRFSPFPSQVEAKEFLRDAWRHGALTPEEQTMLHTAHNLGEL